MGEDIFQQVLSTISRIEASNANQAEVNKLWVEIRETFLNEMSSLPDLPLSNCNKLNNKRGCTISSGK